MPIEIKKLENAPNWVDNLSRLDECAEILEVLKKRSNTALNKDDIERITGNTYTSRIFRGMLSAGVIQQKAGYYYIKNDSRADKVIDLGT